MNQALNAAAAPRAERPPLSLFLWILCGYLVLDAGLRISDLIVHLTGTGELTRSVLQYNFEGVMFATLDLLLCLQILLRTLAARIFGSILFLFHMGSAALKYGVRNPEVWLNIEPTDRLRVLGHLIFCAVALVLLNRGRSRELLRN